jgi:hypothetical protein
VSKTFRPITDVGTMLFVFMCWIAAGILCGTAFGLLFVGLSTIINGRG